MMRVKSSKKSSKLSRQTHIRIQEREKPTEQEENEIFPFAILFTLYNILHNLPQPHPNCLQRRNMKMALKHLTDALHTHTHKPRFFDPR